MSDIINGVPRELLERIACEVTPKTHQEMFDSAKDFAAAIKELRALLTAQPQASDEFPFAGFDPNFCPSSNPDNPQTEEDRPQASAAQSAPAGEREAFRSAVLAKYPNTTFQVKHDGAYLGWIDDAFWGFQAGAAWQRTQSAGGLTIPDGWRIERRELDGSVCFIIGSPRMAGVRSNTSVWLSDSDPAHLLLWHLLDAAPAQPVARDQGEVERLREALEAIADCTDDDQARNCALIALSASTGQEVEP